MPKGKKVEKTSTKSNKDLSGKISLRKSVLKNSDYNLDSLSDKEMGYFKMMYPQSGVLYLKSRPGVAKSSIMASIANKLGFRYFDLRLAMLDETDVGLFPSLTVKSTDEGDIKYLEHVVPEWAMEANKGPCIVHFEELNRAPHSVRNAALQILNERAIGTKFKFNHDVYMVASGNLGEKDGTEVEEFDSALNNRLIHIDHDLTTSEWISEFADANIHPLILSYIESNPGQLYPTLRKLDDGFPEKYASPRSWHFLSDYLLYNYGEKTEGNENDLLTELKLSASNYIGSSNANEFINFVNEILSISTKDVLNKYKMIRDDVLSAPRGVQDRLLTNLKEGIDVFEEINDKQFKNVIDFVLDLPDEHKYSYIHSILASAPMEYFEKRTRHKRVDALAKAFPEIRDNIKAINGQSGKNKIDIIGEEK